MSITPTKFIPSPHFVSAIVEEYCGTPTLTERLATFAFFSSYVGENRYSALTFKLLEVMPQFQETLNKSKEGWLEQRFLLDDEWVHVTFLRDLRTILFGYGVEVGRGDHNVITSYFDLFTGKQYVKRVPRHENLAHLHLDGIHIVNKLVGIEGVCHPFFYSKIAPFTFYPRLSTSLDRLLDSRRLTRVEFNLISLQLVKTAKSINDRSIIMIDICSFRNIVCQLSESGHLLFCQYIDFDVWLDFENSDQLPVLKKANRADLIDNLQELAKSTEGNPSFVTHLNKNEDWNTLIARVESGK